MASKLLHFESFTLDLDRSRLLGPAGEVALRPKSFDVVRHLLENAGRIVAKDELMKAVWPGVTVSDESLAQCVSEIRRSLGAAGPRIVKTVPRRGYAIDVPVSVATEPADGDPAGILRDSAADARVSIAVLPFEAMGSTDNADLDRLTDGLSEDVIAGLSRIRAFWVIASSTMSIYKGRAVDVREVGRNLDVHYVVSGRLRQADDRLRLSVQLTETATGRQLWAATFDRAAGGGFELLDDLTQCVVASVQVQLIVSEGRAAARKAPSAAPLGDLLARSRERLYRATADGLTEAVASAEKALQLDPANGEACRLLAAATWHQAYKGYIPWDVAAFERVASLAQRAVLAEDADEFSHWAQALAHLMMGQHERATVSLRRALDINPSFSLAYGTLGTVLAWAGASEESIANNRRALKINPGDPLNPHRYFGLALAHYLARRYAPAVDDAARAVQVLPDWWLGMMIYAASLAEAGRLAEARTVAVDLGRTRPGTTLASLANLPFARAEDRDHLAHGLRKAGLPER
ncbi:MAG: winged helix-turn-helix domain-containing protein [Reyranella sp.]|nr:winged helix-turn-helix domain-containing protein [Reyranella sp.]